MALQVPFHGFSLLLQCTKWSDHSPVTKMCCGELNMYQSTLCLVWGDSREPKQLTFPIPQKEGQAHGAPFFHGCKDRPRQKWKQSSGASLVGDFVSLKRQHKLGQWMPYDEFIQKGALTSLCWLSSIWKAEIIRFNEISSHHTFLHSLSFLLIELLHRDSIFHPTSPGQGEEKIESACWNT